MKPDRVLLVDDEVEFVETLAKRMQARGLDVRIATSGSEALTKVTKDAFDVVVLDMAMPGMDGIETLKRMHEVDPDLHILLLTGQGTVQTAVEAMNLGAMDFLQKPTGVGVLMEKIKEARTEKVMLAEKKSRDYVEDILRSRGW